MKESIFRQVRGAREKLLNYIRSEQTARDRAGWLSYDDATAQTWQEALGREFTDGLTLGEFVEQERRGLIDKNPQAKYYAAEVMGAGGIFRTFPKGIIDGSLGITLVDVRTDQQKNDDKLIHHDEQALGKQDWSTKRSPGDVLNPVAYRKARIWLREHNTDGFNFVMLKPNPAGMKTIPKNPNVYIHVISELYSLLSNNGGILIAELPWAWDPPELAIVNVRLTEISHIPGIEVIRNKYGFRIRKTEDAPKGLY